MHYLRLAYHLEPRPRYAIELATTLGIHGTGLRYAGELEKALEYLEESRRTLESVRTVKTDRYEMNNVLYYIDVIRGE